MIGDWTGTGIASGKIALFRTTAAWWYRDNGNRWFSSCAEDQCSYFGAFTDKPVAFGKSLVKAN